MNRAYACTCTDISDLCTYCANRLADREYAEDMSTDDRMADDYAEREIAGWGW